MLQAQHQARVTNSPLPHPALGAYPLLAPGSVKATPQKLAATWNGGTRGSRPDRIVRACQFSPRSPVTLTALSTTRPNGRTRALQGGNA
jgi:hypothetical protein